MDKPFELHRALARGLFGVDKWRLGEAMTLRYLREFERTQFLSLEELKDLQLGRLRALVRHAQANCPFYATRFQQWGLDAGQISDLQSLVAFPILEKQDIQKHRDRLVAANWPPSDVLPNFTGGSTGQPLSLFLNKERKCSREAATIRHNQWAGWRIGDKVAHPRNTPGHAQVSYSEPVA